MESIREKYRQKTGKEPGRILVLTGELEESIDQFISEHGKSIIGREEIFQEEFLNIGRTQEGYEIEGVELQKTNGRVNKTYFDERNVPSGYLGESLRNLEVGDSITLHFSGRTEKDLTRKLGKYLHYSPAKSSMLGEAQNMEEIKITLSVDNRYGIHARPAAMIVKHCSKYDSEIDVELGETKVSAKSIMGLMTLEATRGKKPTFYANGSDAQEAIDGLVKLFESKFDEE